ncbi:MAG: hypothetical protein HFP77_09000 [Methylococcales symbiont of Iophon sp. n. MRB-2018]|nr:MAG: hypothetical protein HFP77_09000 [Methylococcales symbiont of Iophon sp. n. MRB-2018]
MLAFCRNYYEVSMVLFAFILLAGCLVFGSVLVLLRTAKKPKVPKDFKAKEYDEDDSSGW